MYKNNLRGKEISLTINENGVLLIMPSLMDFLFDELNNSIPIDWLEIYFAQTGNTELFGLKQMIDEWKEHIRVKEDE